MIFFALGYRYEEDIFLDFATNETTHNLTASCLLPTEQMATEQIVEIYGSDFAVVKVTIAALSKEGTMTCDYDGPTEWIEEEID